MTVDGRVIVTLKEGVGFGPYVLEHDAAQLEDLIYKLIRAIKPFTFQGYPDSFSGQDAECESVLVSHADVQRARTILNDSRIR